MTSMHDHRLRLIAQLERVDPDFRKDSGVDGAGAIVLAIRQDSIERAVDASSFLPDDAGEDAVRTALLPFAIPKPENPADCWFCGVPSTPNNRTVVASSPQCAVCESCARRALNVAPVQDGAYDDLAPDHYCGFCRAGPESGGGELLRGRFASLCRSCATLAVELFEEDQKDTRTGI